jgi:hypothetical protein
MIRLLRFAGAMCSRLYQSPKVPPVGYAPTPTALQAVASTRLASAAVNRGAVSGTTAHRKESHFNGGPQKRHNRNREKETPTYSPVGVEGESRTRTPCQRALVSKTSVATSYTTST